MIVIPLPLFPALFAATLGLAPDVEAANATFQAVTQTGLEVGDQTVRLPEPTLSAELSPEEQVERLTELAGSSRGFENLVRDSIAAPYILKSQDVRTEDAIVRTADLWFVIRAELAEFDPAQAAEEADGQTAEAGNMSVTSRLVPEAEDAETDGDADRWRVHLKGRLLDRIGFDVTNRVEVTRSDDAVLVASRTDPRLASEGDPPNRWFAIADADPTEPAKPEDAEPYAGGVSYALIRPLEAVPGALVVEAHFAFVEPRGWFRGAPILRSKFSLIAQDQIRALRRELARNADGR